MFGEVHLAVNADDLDRINCIVRMRDEHVDVSLHTDISGDFLVWVIYVGLWWGSPQLGHSNKIRALQSTYPARSICTDLVSETNRLEFWSTVQHNGNTGTMSSLLATITCRTRAVMRLCKEHMHDPISRCDRQI